MSDQQITKTEYESYKGRPRVFLYLGKSPAGNVRSVSGTYAGHRAGPQGPSLFLARELHPSSPFGDQTVRYVLTTIPFDRPDRRPNIWGVSAGQSDTVKRHRNPSFIAQALALFDPPPSPFTAVALLDIDPEA